MSNSSSPNEAFIIFELADTLYAISSQAVQQMEMVDRITPVPNAPHFVEGVVFSRGQVIPVINLRVRFGFEKIPYNLRTRLIVTQSQNRTIGLIVDTAREFIVIPENAIQPPNEEISGLSGHYLAGIATLGERIILILKVEEVFEMPDSSLSVLS
ncbi:chemotaxis protein CheW [Spirulina subsalsa FACHB-351]|uniref:Chemotaxis protein CheW n=1 Tax=Spirulina subsalsa FACHB-351 TaxID=234711 RepID=A0ABT3LA05_9CYAN|nr:chemotaxis protein CheW [Spirulina subsalsa]MCW6037977.1 chemotaxis protein CheW [Spirulina subsalsa FACHB-351]